MRRILGLLGALLGLLPPSALADEPPEEPGEAAAAFIARIEVAPALQDFLDATIEGLRARDARLRQQEIRVALVDLPVGGAPQLAHWNGDSPVYPASVPKFAYLMAAYAWRDQGRLRIDAELDRQLQAMIYHSSNRATQRVVRRLTLTEAGPRLGPDAYEDFVWRRHAVKRWLQDLGIGDLHLVHPTYDGGGDLYGRDEQFLQDQKIEGALPDQKGPYFNRQAMTANGTARLLALLAEDLALSPESSAEVRERMRRDTRRQPYLRKRIAGGVEDRRDQFEIFAKTGTWGPIFSDAGILRCSDGHQLVVVAFLEGRPAYRGSFIAELTRAVVERLFTPAAAPSDPLRTLGPRGAARG